MDYVIETYHLGDFVFHADDVAAIDVDDDGFLWVHHGGGSGDAFAPSTWTRWYLRDAEGTEKETHVNDT